MIKKSSEIIELDELIGMISSMASLDFSKRLDIEITEAPINVIAYGLNMLSEELESNVVKKSLLEEVNTNLEQFAYTVAHDIRLPFNSAVGLLSLIESDLVVRKNEALGEYISLLKGIHECIAEMINGILEYSKNNFNSLNLEEVSIQDICNEIANYHRAKHDLTITFGLAIPHVCYNAVALKQILSNLMGNAINYCDKEVCILNIDCADKDAYYEVSIKDNGPGIKQEYLDKAFDLFENFKSDRENSYGIGLSIVKKIITQTGGTIRIESVEGEGAKFIFTIKK